MYKKHSFPFDLLVLLFSGLAVIALMKVDLNRQLAEKIETSLDIPQTIMPSSEKEYEDPYYCRYFLGEWYLDGELLVIDQDTCSGKTEKFSISISPMKDDFSWGMAVFCVKGECYYHPVAVDQLGFHDLWDGHFLAVRKP